MVTSGIIMLSVTDSCMSFEGFREIEKDYYEIDGCTKRFFTIDSLSEIMRGFSIKRIYEQETRKYREEKKTIVCEAYKSTI